MTKFDLDTLRLAYKKAIDEWVDTIRAEEALATPDDSMVAMEHWMPHTSKNTMLTPKPPNLAKPAKTLFAMPITASSRSLLLAYSLLLILPSNGLRSFHRKLYLF